MMSINKKFWAREILIFWGLVGTVLICFLALTAFEIMQAEKIADFEREKLELEDGLKKKVQENLLKFSKYERDTLQKILSTQYKFDAERFLKDFYLNSDIEQQTKDQLIETLKGSRLVRIYTNYWGKPDSLIAMAFTKYKSASIDTSYLKTIKQKYGTIQSTSLTNDEIIEILLAQLIMTTNQEIISLDSKISKYKTNKITNKDEITLAIAILLLVILYPIRIIVWSIKWSINAIRVNKNE